jgi:hypothetical protein
VNVAAWRKVVLDRKFSDLAWRGADALLTKWNRIVRSAEDMDWEEQRRARRNQEGLGQHTLRYAFANAVAIVERPSFRPGAKGKPVVPQRNKDADDNASANGGANVVEKADKVEKEKEKNVDEKGDEEKSDSEEDGEGDEGITESDDVDEYADNPRRSSRSQKTSLRAMDWKQKQSKKVAARKFGAVANGAGDTGKRDEKGRWVGCTYASKTSTWRASLTIFGQLETIGTFASGKRAAQAYDVAAIACHGRTTTTNFGEQAYREADIAEERLRMRKLVFDTQADTREVGDHERRSKGHERVVKRGKGGLFISDAPTTDGVMPAVPMDDSSEDANSDSSSSIWVSDANSYEYASSDDEDGEPVVKLEEQELPTPRPSAAQRNLKRLNFLVFDPEEDLAALAARAKRLRRLSVSGKMLAPSQVTDSALSSSQSSLLSVSSPSASSSSTATDTSPASSFSKLQSPKLPKSGSEARGPSVSRSLLKVTYDAFILTNTDSSTTMFRGVSLRSREYGRPVSFRATITVGGKSIFLGYFATKALSARAYDLASMVFHGQRATTNFNASSYQASDMTAMHAKLEKKGLIGVPPIGEHDYQDQANMDAKPALGTAPLGYIFESTLPAASLMVSIPSPTLTVTPALVLASSSSMSPTPSPIPTVTPAAMLTSSSSTSRTPSPILSFTLVAPVEAPQAEAVSSLNDVVDAVFITSATAASIPAHDAPSSST